MSRKTDLQRLIVKHQRRLQNLEEQKASFGLNTPAHILTEIEDVEVEVERLQEELITAADNEDPTLFDLAPDPAPSDPPPGDNTFNMQGATIRTGVLNQGGVQHLSGPLNVDLSETTTQVESGGTYIAGDQFSGDFRGAIVNVRSQLENVKQSIEALPNLAGTEKEALTGLINQLRAQLEQLPPEKASEAEKVVKRLDSLVQELAEAEPDLELIPMMTDSLHRAAKNLVDLIPAVGTITTQIVAHILKMMG